MIPIPVALVFVVIVGVCGGIGWLLAHARPMTTGEIRAVVGPVHQAYATDPVTLHAALVRQVGRVRGASVARTTPTTLDVNVRPSLSRTDDGMGLFVHIAVSDRPGGGAVCAMHGQPKSVFAIESSSERALRGFDRELRMGLKRDEGIRVFDVDGASTPYTGAPTPTPMPAPPHAPPPPSVPAPAPPPYPTPPQATPGPVSEPPPSSGAWWS